jgi:hypothetical protein
MAECAETPEQLAALVLKALQLPPAIQARVPYSIEKAADGYQRLFRFF